MSVQIAGIFLASGAVKSLIIEEALRRQSLAGGAFDTALLEAGAKLTEVQYLVLLEKASGLPSVRREVLLAADSALTGLFPVRLAERFGLLPFKAQGRALHVAATYPVAKTILEELGMLLDLEIRPYVALEVCIKEAQFKFYRSLISARFSTIQKLLNTQNNDQENKRDHKCDKQLKTSSSRTLAQAKSELNSASNRHVLIDVTLQFALNLFDFAAALTIKNGKANSWAALSHQGAIKMAELSIPLNEPSFFHTVLKARGHFLGPVPKDELSQSFLKQLNRPNPRTAFLCPVFAGEKPLAFLYGDVINRPISGPKMADFVMLAQYLGIRLRDLALECRRIKAASKNKEAMAEKCR